MHKQLLALVELRHPTEGNNKISHQNNRHLIRNQKNRSSLLLLINFVDFLSTNYQRTTKPLDFLPYLCIEHITRLKPCHPYLPCWKHLFRLHCHDEPATPYESFLFTSFLGTNQNYYTKDEKFQCNDPDIFVVDFETTREVFTEAQHKERKRCKVKAKVLVH